MAAGLEIADTQHKSPNLAEREKKKNDNYSATISLQDQKATEGY